MNFLSRSFAIFAVATRRVAVTAAGISADRGWLLSIALSMSVRYTDAVYYRILEELSQSGQEDAATLVVPSPSCFAMSARLMA